MTSERPLQPVFFSAELTFVLIADRPTFYVTPVPPPAPPDLRDQLISLHVLILYVLNNRS